MKIKEFLDTYLYKEDVQQLAEHLGLKVGGLKEEIIDRVLNCPDFEIEDITITLYKEDVQNICRDFSLPVTGTKDELWDNLVEELGWEEKTIRKGEINKEQLVEEREIEYSSVEEMIQSWVPAKRYKTEEGYQSELGTYLELKHNLKVQLEAGKTQVDILVNGNLPIELKKNQKRDDFDRLVGQIERNIETYRKLIVVICQLETRQIFIEYKNRLEPRFSEEELIWILK